MLQTSLPGGAAYTEMDRPYLLKKHMNWEYAESISSNMKAKVDILLAQVIFLFFGFLIVNIKFKENITASKYCLGLFVYPAAVIFTSVIFLLSFLLYRKD